MKQITLVVFQTFILIDQFFFAQCVNSFLTEHSVFKLFIFNSHMYSRADPPSLALFRASKLPQKAQQNKSTTVNKKQNQDEKDWTTFKVSDSSQVKEAKNRLKLVVNKLIASNKEKELLTKENKSLREENLALQTNLRQMIPGFANTSSSFPIQNELIGRVAEFYKHDCLNKFFDLLCPEMTTQGVVYFFSTSFRSSKKSIEEYFNVALDRLRMVGCFDTLDGPIMNVLRKSFQGNYEEIVSKILERGKVQRIVDQIQDKLQLQNKSKEANEEIRLFLESLGELIVFSVISDPPLEFDVESIGSKVAYNGLKHEAFDGFIKPKEECWVVLPELRRGKEGEMMLKALVLQTSYVIYS